MWWVQAVGEVAGAAVTEAFHDPGPRGRGRRPSEVPGVASPGQQLSWEEKTEKSQLDLEGTGCQEGQPDPQRAQGWVLFKDTWPALNKVGCRTRIQMEAHMYK